jgi:hypothetical protein
VVLLGKWNWWPSKLHMDGGEGGKHRVGGQTAPVSSDVR